MVDKLTLCYVTNNQQIRESLKIKKTNKKEIAKWIKTWEKAGSALNRIKLNELRSGSYYSQNQMLLNEMLRYAFEHRETRLSSGLVEQQQIFMKLKKEKSGRSKWLKPKKQSH